MDSLVSAYSRWKALIFMVIAGFWTVVLLYCTVRVVLEAGDWMTVGLAAGLTLGLALTTRRCYRTVRSLARVPRARADQGAIAFDKTKRSR